MNNPPKRQSIFWMVRVLVAVGLATIIFLIALTGREIRSIQTARAKLQREQAQLYQVSEEILSRSSEARLEIVALLAGDAAAGKSGAAAGLEVLIDQLIGSADSSFGSAAPHQLHAMIDHLAEVERRALLWRSEYDAIWLDVRAQRTQGQARDLVAELHEAVESFEGKQKLQEARQLKRWRSATGQEAARLAQAMIVEQDRQQTYETGDLSRELAEIATLVELLGSEQQQDNLPNLKVNKLTPALARLKEKIDDFGESQMENGVLTAQTIERLKTSLLGAGETHAGAYQSTRVGIGGLYAIRWNTLRLQNEREALGNERAMLSEKIDAAVAAMMLSAREQSETLARQVEQRLASSWRWMMIAGVCCSVLFGILAWLISRAIRGQVGVIERATAEAEAGRLTAEQLVRDRERAEMALQESKEKLRQIVEHSAQVFYSHNTEGRFTYVSPQVVRFLDCSQDEALRRWTDFLTDNPLNEEGIELTRLAIETGEPQRPYQLEIKTQQGRIVWVEAHESPVVVAGTTTAIVGALSDITERKQAEARQRMEEERYLRQRNALIAFAGEIARTGEDFMTTLRRLTETAAKTLGVARVSIWRYNSDRTAIRCVDLYELTANQHSDGLELPASAYPGYFRALEVLDVIAANDAHRDPRTSEFSDGYLQPLGINSMLDAPIHLGGGGAGVLCHEHIGPMRQWTTDEETFAVAVANRVSLVLEGAERKRAEQELRSAHAQLEQMLTHSPAIVYRLRLEDERMVPMTISANITGLLGYTLSETLDNPAWWMEQLHQEDHDRVLARSAEILQLGSGRIEYRVRHKDGSYRWIEDNQRVLRDVSGQPKEIVGVWLDINERKHAEAALEEAHQELVEVSRQAGMAEVATSVLHNVGNVLNSVNISATLVADGVRKSKASNLARVVELLESHAADLGAFLTDDPQGRNLSAYLRQLSDRLTAEQTAIIAEVNSLRQNIEHIKDIVAMQQSYANVSGVTETVHITDLIEDTLRMNVGSLTRHEVRVVRDFAEVPPMVLEKHKVLQILVNLVRNAKQACDDSHRTDKLVTLRVFNGDGTVKIAVADNGIGILPENLTSIFNHGFTTKKDGHGFGLHSSANAAREMGGSLGAQSDGPGHGAVFTLELPMQYPANR